MRSFRRPAHILLYGRVASWAWESRTWVARRLSRRSQRKSPQTQPQASAAVVPFLSLYFLHFFLLAPFFASHSQPFFSCFRFFFFFFFFLAFLSTNLPLRSSLQRNIEGASVESPIVEGGRTSVRAFSSPGGGTGAGGTIVVETSPGGGTGGTGSSGGGVSSGGGRGGSPSGGGRGGSPSGGGTGAGGTIVVETSSG